MAGCPPLNFPGLHVVYGSRTRRGLNHANEDRHAVAVWRDWRPLPQQEALNTEEDTTNYPKPTLVIPSCTTSARKDTSISGVVAIGKISGGGDSQDASDDHDDRKAYLWTVCDGHDGPEAANFVCRNIGDSFSKIWHISSPSVPPPSSISKKTDESELYLRGYTLSNALARTFETLDASFKSIVMDGGQLEACTAGSCVTSIFLNGNLMCCACLGGKLVLAYDNDDVLDSDCKAAILTLEESDGSAAQKVSPNADTATTTSDDSKTSKTTQQFQVTWFSKEHRSSSPKERARIRARGGWFRHGRVGGVLEPTRTIGDFDVKASQPPGVVIATPEVRTFSVIKPALVLVASDGVWDVMDASQLLRTLKKRRRLWRGILSWLGAPIPEKRSLMNFGFRRRAKSKEGLESLLQIPTGGDLCSMAETLAHDLGSDDDCTCVCIYLRPVGTPKTAEKLLQSPDDIPPPCGEADLLHPSGVTAGETPEDDDDDDEDLEEYDDVLEEDDKDTEYSPGADSYSEYEKWRNPGAAEAEEDAKEEEPKEEDTTNKDDNAWDLSTTTFPVALVATSEGMYTLFPSSTVDAQDAPEVIEKARKRREERRAARERRWKTLSNIVYQEENNNKY